MRLALNRSASRKEIAAINKQLPKTNLTKRLNAKKYCGVIKLGKDALFIQKELRSEWH
jgi:hypothetical protein